MDAEKVTEVEMKELIPEVQDDKDVEKGKVEETKGKKKNKSIPMLDIVCPIISYLNHLVMPFFVL